MTDLTPQLNGNPSTRTQLNVPAGGPWFADCSLPGVVSLSGRVTLSIGEAQFLGTVDPEFSGNFAGASFFRIVGGGGGWGKSVPRKSYANDAGVKAINVARDVAGEVGETIGAFAPSRERFGSTYARRVCLASQVLEDAAAGVPWWVGFDGLTNVSERSLSTPDPKLHHVVDWEPIEQLATISIQDPSVIQIGSQLTDERWAGTKVVQEFTLKAEGSTVLVEAYCGATAGDSGRLPSLLRRFIRKTIDPRLSVKWRYRVRRVNTDGRLDLVALNQDAPFPDLPRVSQYSTGYVEPKSGAVVLVEFLEGDASLARCAPVSDTRDPGFVPDRLTFGASDPSLGFDAAYVGSNCNILLPPMSISGTMLYNGQTVPLTGVAISVTATTLGVVSIGSTKVGIGT
jgi:hypothetical protein